MISIEKVSSFFFLIRFEGDVFGLVNVFKSFESDVFGLVNVFVL